MKGPKEQENKPTFPEVVTEISPFAAAHFRRTWPGVTVFPALSPKDFAAFSTATSTSVPMSMELSSVERISLIRRPNPKETDLGSGRAWQ